MRTPKTDDESAAVGERNRAKTTDNLKLSLKRLVETKQRVSISAVAKAAGVTPALIHNKYPDIAELIRRQIGKSTRVKQDETREQLAEARSTIKKLREEIRQLEEEVRKLASINESLRHQNAYIQAVAKSKNVISL